MPLSVLMEFIACECDGTHGGSGGEAWTRAAGPSEQSTRTTASSGELTASGDNTKTEGVVQVVQATRSGSTH